MDLKTIEDVFVRDDIDTFTRIWQWLDPTRSVSFAGKHVSRRICASIVDRCARNPKLLAHLSKMLQSNNDAGTAFFNENINNWHRKVERAFARKRSWILRTAYYFPSICEAVRQHNLQMLVFIGDTAKELKKSKLDFTDAQIAALVDLVPSTSSACRAWIGHYLKERIAAKSIKSLLGASPGIGRLLAEHYSIYDSREFTHVGDLFARALRLSGRGNIPPSFTKITIGLALVHSVQLTVAMLRNDDLTNQDEIFGSLPFSKFIPREDLEQMVWVLDMATADPNLMREVLPKLSAIRTMYGTSADQQYAADLRRLLASLIANDESTVIKCAPRSARVEFMTWLLACQRSSMPSLPEEMRRMIFGFLVVAERPVLSKSQFEQRRRPVFQSALAAYTAAESTFLQLRNAVCLECIGGEPQRHAVAQMSAAFDQLRACHSRLCESSPHPGVDAMFNNYLDGYIVATRCARSYFGEAQEDDDSEDDDSEEVDSD